MPAPDWSIFLFVGFMALLGIGLAAVAISGLEEYLRNKSFQKFESELAAAISHSQPTWDEVQAMARVSGIPISKVVEACALMLKEILIGRNNGLGQHKALIQEYIAAHEESEPFEGLPMQ